MRLAVLLLALTSLAAHAQHKPAAVPTVQYGDPFHGVTLNYPTVWATNPAPDYLGPAFAGNGFEAQATFAFSPKGNLYEKTVLNSLVFTYFIVPGKDLSACTAHAKEATGGTARPTTVRINDTTYTEFTGSSAGMCHQQRSQVDVTFRNNVCYAFERDFNTRCFGAGDGARKLTQAEQKALQRHLDAIMQSVSFR